jgi:HPt (histidine-containing phosphotransfer) domain-containing protein
MSILSSIIEQSSCTVPYSEAKPVMLYNNKEEIARQQAIVEELEREILAEENKTVGIEGLDKPKKKRIVEESKPIKKAKHKSYGNFMDDIIEEEVEEDPVEEVGDKSNIPSQAHKINGLLSKLCSNYDSKETEEVFVPRPVSPTISESKKIKTKKHKKNKKHGGSK